MNDLSKPRIVCAANRLVMGGETIYTFVGARHWDKHMRMLVPLIQDWAKPDKIHWEPGFIDQYENFYSRKQAWPIAEANGQIVRRVGGDESDGGTLYSENLY